MQIMYQIVHPLDTSCRVATKSENAGEIRKFNFQIRKIQGKIFVEKSEKIREVIELLLLDFRAVNFSILTCTSR